VDAAQDQEEEWLWTAVLDRSPDFQATVVEALRRLATGEYGLCADCGQHIPLARLRALPFAIRCLSCQERLEREAKRRVALAGSRGRRFVS
jgi:DnaK suppressor protein